jgi:hypothetical protein
MVLWGAWWPYRRKAAQGISKSVLCLRPAWTPAPALHLKGTRDASLLAEIVEARARSESREAS